MALNGCQHIYTICSKLVTRAITACRPSSNLHSVQQIAVTLRNQDHSLTQTSISVTISDTGKALPDDIKVLKTVFNGLFTTGVTGICDQQVMVKTTDLHESSIRAYKVMPGSKGADHPAVSVVRLPNLAKQSRLPFAGSEVSLQLMSTVHAEDVVSCVQALLELGSMIAPRTQLDLRLKGFALEIMVVHTCQGDAEEEKPGNVTLNYDIEPLPFDLTPEQRFFEGLKAWFEDDDPRPQPCDASQQTYADTCPAVAPLHHSMPHYHEQNACSPHPAPGHLEADHLSQQPDEVEEVAPPFFGVPMPHICHSHSPTDAHASMVLQQAHSTQEVLEQHYLAVEQATPMTQFATSQEYMYGDEAPLDMHGVELPEGYRHDHPGGEGGVCSDNQYGLEQELLSDQHMHDATWHTHGAEPYGDSEDREDLTAGPRPECDDGSNTLQGVSSRPMLAIAIGQAGADAQKAGPNGKQQGAMLQRSKWTAQVGLVLHSLVPSPLTGYVLPQGNAQVYLFQNYALLQRPPDSCLKALEKFAWQSFGLEAEVQALPSGAITMTFGAKSDALAQDISALVVHLYTQDTKLDLSVGKAPALAAVTEAKLIKVALEDALSKLKTHFQGSLCNKVEKRLQQCLPYLAKSLGKLVINSNSPELQSHACQLMSCELDSLQQEIELRLQDAAAVELYGANPSQTPP